MAIGTLAELKTAIGTYSNTPAYSATVLSELVALAEARLNRELPLRVNWASTTLTGSVGSASLALPSGYVESDALFLSTYSPALVELSKRDVISLEQVLTNGTPTAWAILGTNIVLDRQCDQAHTFILHYRVAFNLATTDPNWLLTNHPDIYLNACLLEAALLTKDSEWGTAVKAKLDEGMAELRRLDARNASGTLVVDPALRRQGGFYNGTYDVSY